MGAPARWPGNLRNRNRKYEPRARVVAVGGASGWPWEFRNRNRNRFITTLETDSEPICCFPTHSSVQILSSCNTRTKPLLASSGLHSYATCGGQQVARPSDRPGRLVHSRCGDATASDWGHQTRVQRVCSWSPITLRELSLWWSALS